MNNAKIIQIDKNIFKNNSKKQVFFNNKISNKSKINDITIIRIEDDVYAGEIKDGKPHGIGSYTWSDGVKYEGEWKDGKYNGQGTYTFADGRIEEGEFRKGKYVGKKEYEDEALKLEEVEELYKNKVITDEERKKMTNKIQGID